MVVVVAVAGRQSVIDDTMQMFAERAEKSGIRLEALCEPNM